MLETKLRCWGVPCAACASYWLPLFFDYWCYLGSCMGAFRCPDPSSSPSSSNLFSSSGEREEKRSLLPAHIFLLMFITCTCLGERDMKCLSLAFPWQKWEGAVPPSFILWEDDGSSVMLPQPHEAALPPPVTFPRPSLLPLAPFKGKRGGC